jgi:hypothetical protein
MVDARYVLDGRAAVTEGTGCGGAGDGGLPGLAGAVVVAVVWLVWYGTGQAGDVIRVSSPTRDERTTFRSNAEEEGTVLTFAIQHR